MQHIYFLCQSQEVWRCTEWRCTCDGEDGSISGLTSIYAKQKGTHNGRRSPVSVYAFEATQPYIVESGLLPLPLPFQ